MRREWHQLSHPGVGATALQTSRPSTDSAEDSALGLDRWRELPRLQMPPWADPDEVASVCRVLDTVPSVEIAPAVADVTPESDTVAEDGTNLSGAITLVEGADQDATLDMIGRSASPSSPMVVRA